MNKIQSEKQKIRILIVDDSKNIRLVIRRYLEMVNHPDFYFEFDEAANGAEAEEKLQESTVMDNPYEVVFLDWMMPTFTGYEFLAKIRSIEQFKTHPSIIMLTAETNSEQINACLKYGVSKYIIKPFTQEMLSQVLIEVLSGSADGGIKYAV